DDKLRIGVARAETGGSSRCQISSCSGSLLSNYPEEGDGPPILVDRLHSRRANLEARLLDKSLVVVHGVAAEVHWRAEPIGFDLAPVGSRAQSRHQQAAGAHPPAHFPEEARKFSVGEMGQRVEGRHAVEAVLSDIQREHVLLDKRGGRDVDSGHADLGRRNIDAVKTKRSANCRVDGPPPPQPSSSSLAPSGRLASRTLA